LEAHKSAKVNFLPWSNQSWNRNRMADKISDNSLRLATNTIQVLLKER